MGKKSPKPPAPPDYAAAAQAQGQANLDAARLTARISNPNVVTPYGSQTVTFGRPVFDEAGYNKAMEAYNKQLADYEARKASGVMTGGPMGGFPGGDYYGMEGRGEGRGGDYGFGGDFGAAPVAPTREQFTRQTDLDTPFIEQKLSPEQQKILEAQQRVDLGLAGLGETALGTVQDVFSKPFQPNLRDLQTSLGGYGAVTGAPNLVGMGQARADVQAGQMPTLNLQGQAGGGPAAPGLQGPDYSGVGGVGQGVGVGEFGFAGAGPSGGLFGLARGGGRPERLQGLNLAGVGGVGNAPQGGQFGMAGGGPAGVQFQGLDVSGIGGPQAAPAQGQFGYAQQFVQGPQLQGQIDVSGLAAAPISAGTTAQQAIMSRLVPQLQGERQQLYTQLINQGLAPGGEAFNAAMSAQALKENDLMLQAAAQGIALDQAARQQGFAEQQSRAMFANQAALQGFGAGMEQAGLYNTGLGQNLQQALATQAAANQAQQQAFGQRLAAGEFGREAQLASFQTGQQAQEAVNRAIAQNFGQAMAASEADRAAQAQRFGQAVAGGEFDRQRALAQFGMTQQAQEARNAAIAQNFAQAQAAQQLQNQARQQNLQGALAAEEAQRAAQAQRFAQTQAATQLGAQLTGQQFGMGQQAQQMQNAAVAQNQAAALDAYRALLAGQQQGFGQQMDVQAARNAALAQNQAIAAQQQQLANAAQLQQYNQALQAAQFGNTALQQSLQQQLALRNQPLNEITALMSGAQVNMPQFQGYQGANVAAAPVFAAQQAAGDFAQRNYANQVANYNAQMGLLGNIAGIAGAAAGGPLGLMGGLFGPKPAATAGTT